MKQDRLFYIAPDIVHLSVTHDHRSGCWTIRCSSSVVTEEGELSVQDGAVYADLSAEEALDVVTAEAAQRLNAWG